MTTKEPKIELGAVVPKPANTIVCQNPDCGSDDVDVYLSGEYRCQCVRCGRIWQYIPRRKVAA